MVHVIDIVDRKFAWVVYSSYEYGGDAPDAVFDSEAGAKKYIKDNNEDGWLEIAKFDLTTGKQV